MLYARNRTLIRIGVIGRITKQNCPSKTGMNWSTCWSHRTEPAPFHPFCTTWYVLVSGRWLLEPVRLERAVRRGRSGRKEWSHSGQRLGSVLVMSSASIDSVLIVTSGIIMALELPVDQQLCPLRHEMQMGFKDLKSELKLEVQTMRAETAKDIHGMIRKISSTVSNFPLLSHSQFANDK
jgi:hypothetical protein